jgi:hypothetical protein
MMIMMRPLPFKRMSLPKLTPRLGESDSYFVDRAHCTVLYLVTLIIISHKR